LTIVPSISNAATLSNPLVKRELVMTTKKKNQLKNKKKQITLPLTESCVVQKQPQGPSSVELLDFFLLVSKSLTGAGKRRKEKKKKNIKTPSYRVITWGGRTKRIR
jgi:hypothetical protein